MSNANVGESPRTHQEQTATSQASTLKNDPAVEAAVSEVAAHPERAADLAKSLGIGGTVPAKPSFLSSPAAHLFRPAFDDPLSRECLPFVNGLNLWDVPAVTEDNSNILGKSFAAAAFLQISRSRPGEGLLPGIFFSMAQRPGDRGLVIAFWTYIERLLWLYGEYVSAAQIANDFAAVLKQDRELVDEADAYLRSKDFASPEPAR